MSARDMAQFSSEAAARDAYFTEDGTAGSLEEAPDSGDGWEDPEQIDTLEGNWLLLRQEQIDGDGDRYFVLVGPDPDRTLAMNRGGGTVEVTESDTFDDLPSMETEDAAREAHAIWLEETDFAEGQEAPDGNEETVDSEGNQWSQWEVIEEVPPWFIFARTREDGEAIEILIAGEHPDGHEVYLHPGAEIDTEPYIYTDFESVEAALAAYFEAVEQGDIPADQQPTGTRPDDDNVGRAAGLPGGGAGTPSQRQAARRGLLGRVVGFSLRNPHIVLLLLVAALLIHRRMSPDDNVLDNTIGRLRDGIGGADV